MCVMVRALAMGSISRTLPAGVTGVGCGVEVFDRETERVVTILGRNSLFRWQIWLQDLFKRWRTLA